MQTTTDPVPGRLQRIFRAEVAGVPIAFFTIMAVLIIAFWQLGALPETGIVGAFAFMWAIGLVFFVIGEKLPIWRTYIGGGFIMAFFGAATLAYFDVVSAEEAAFLSGQVLDNQFLYFLLVALIAASILSIPRSDLIRAIGAYIPLIFAAVGGAFVFGIVGGLLLGKPPSESIIYFVLPIIGGGNGAGAIPMSEIYADATGLDGSAYYSVAIAILTLANLMAILIAALLHRLGEKVPSLTGNGRLLKGSEEIAFGKDDAGAATGKSVNTQGSVFFVIAVLLVAFMLYQVMPLIHVFAWVVLLISAISLLDILSDDQKAALQAVSSWGMRLFLVIVLVAVGLTTDLGEMAAALAIDNIILALLVVIGAVLGAGLLAPLVGCYPIEAAISAGLCMANRGGSGDIEVLGASKRMALFPYAQVSSRIGGGMVLMLAGFLFAGLLG